MRSVSFALSCGLAASVPNHVYKDAKYAVDSTNKIVFAQGVYCHDNQCTQTHIQDLTLDLWQPYHQDPAEGPRPGIVLIHGGGYTGGDETSQSKACAYWASRGFVAVTINYRLDQIRYTLDSGLVPANWSFSVANPLPPDYGYTPDPRGVYAANRDAKAAVRWLRSQAATYNIDPNFIGAAGGSSGAQTVIGLASTFEWDFTTEMTAADDPTIGSINPGFSSSILAGVSWAANPIVTDMKIAFDGVPRWQSWNAPLALYRGSDDELMTLWSQNKIKSYMDASGVQCDLFPVPGESHNTLMNGQVEGMPIMTHAYLWLAKAMGLTLIESPTAVAV